MGKFETEILPKGILEAKTNIKKLQDESLQIGTLLDDSDDASEHDCDCNRCPLQDVRILDSLEYEKLESEQNEILKEIKILEDELGRMNRYRDFVQGVKP